MLNCFGYGDVVPTSSILPHFFSDQAHAETESSVYHTHLYLYSVTQRVACGVIYDVSGRLLELSASRKIETDDEGEQKQAMNAFAGVEWGP